MDLLKNLKRDFVESSRWVPMEENKEGLLVLTTDPERVRASRIVSNVFPKRQDRLPGRRPQREFKSHAGPVLRWRRHGDGAAPTSASCFGKLDDESDDEDLAAWAATTSRSRRTTSWSSSSTRSSWMPITRAHPTSTSSRYPGKGKTEVRFRKDGTLVPYISVPAQLSQCASSARLKIMCDLDISEKRKPQDGKIKFKKFGPLDIELRVATDALAGRRRGHRHAYSGRGRAHSARQARPVGAQR